MAPTTVSAASSPREATEPAFESWRSVMQRLPKPNNACLVASYPALEWHQVPCAQPPTSPLLPAFGAKHETVGDGKDFAAVVPGQISFAEGGFSNLSGVKSEYVLKRKHHIANTYSLQLNTQFFSTESCATLGSPDPQGCYGWEQFAYDTGPPIGLFIEYWLVDFGPVPTQCPSHWHKYVARSQNEVNCWINSPLITTPVEPITALAKLRLLGSAAYDSRSQDFAELTVGYSDLYYVGGQNWFPDLSTQWQDVEFNILGDCCGDQAVFNAGSTIDAHTEVDSGVTSAPTCAIEGFTAESNNLFLTQTSGKWKKPQYPSIVFTETNDSHKHPSCVKEAS
jgi:hypothetical protein